MNKIQKEKQIVLESINNSNYLKRLNSDTKIEKYDYNL